VARRRRPVPCFGAWPQALFRATLRKLLRSGTTYDFSRLWIVYFALSINAWLWSAVFHARCVHCRASGASDSDNRSIESEADAPMQCMQRWHPLVLYLCAH
jgi:hypothetical protein